MNKVEIVSIDIPFWDMVRFMVKWAFASIPAAIIVVVVWALILMSWSAYWLGR